MGKKATIKYRSLRSNLVHLPLSLYAQLAQSQTRPQGIILHISPLIPVPGSSSSRASEAYLGWSGLAAASSLGLAGVGASTVGRGRDGMEGNGEEVLETLEIDPEVGKGLGLSEGTIVEISIIHNPTRARSVSVTPLTSDDWEILEQNASFLEENLLSQLRAARKGQEIDVWVRGRTKIRIRVDDTDPGTSTAVLLNHDTEVYVSPRPRGMKATPKEESQVIQPNGISGKGKEKAPNGSTGAKGFKARLIPGRVASTWGQPESTGAKDGRVLYCGKGVMERARRKFGGSGDTFVTIEKVNLEGDDDTPKKEADGAKDDVTRKEAGEKAESDAEKQLECCLVEWDEIPEGHVVLGGKVDEEWDGWHVVRIQAAVRGGRAKTKRPAVDSKLPQPTPRSPMAGVNKLVEGSLAYFRRMAVSDRPRPLLLTGAKGSGKTSVARLIGDMAETDRDIMSEIMYEDVGRIEVEGRISTIKEKMSAWVEQARRKSPCLLILDGLDMLLPPENELTPSSNTAALAHHFCALFDPESIPPGVLVVATAISSQGLHPSLNQRHVFGEAIKIPPASKDIRREILELLVGQQMLEQRDSGPHVNGDAPKEIDFVTLASMTEGYTAADLKDLVGSALQQALIRCAQSEEQVAFTMDDFTSAQAAFTPLSLRGVSLQKSDVKWADIGGLHEPRRILRETLEWPTKYAQIFANCPLRLRSGLLLYGYPGCGKTMLASAVARECGLNFISVKGPEILNKYIGASEKSVRDLFERASAAKPCILFFDEFDSIAPKRGHDSTGVTDRVVNQLLTEMDGAQGLDGVYVLAATSRPDLIDSALLRPGRLDKSLLCDMPSQQDRLEILTAVSAKLTFDPSIDFEYIASETEGLSGADLQAVVYNAHLEVVQASIAGMEEGGGVAQQEKGKGKGKGKAAEVDGKGAVNGKGKGKASGIGGLEEAKPVAEKKRKMWTQVAPEGADEMPGLTARLDALLARGGNATGKKEEIKKAPTPVIQQKHLLKSLASTRPSVAPADFARLKRIYSSFVADRDGTMANGDLGRETGTRASLM